MNKAILVGRITKELELKKTTNGKSIVNFSLAVARDYKNAEGVYETDFIPCTAFGPQADILCEYATKGDLVCVSGNLQTSQYVDSENKKHTSYYVLTDRVQFLNSKRKDEPVEPVEKSIEKSAAEITDDDLPF